MNDPARPDTSGAVAAWRDHPGRVDVPLLALAGLGLFVPAILLPAVTFDSLFGGAGYSVWGGIAAFFQQGNILLGLLLTGFSIMFPVAKLGAILQLWFVPLQPDRRRVQVEWLELLGKWSVLDAFVIAVLIGSVQLGILTEAKPELGAYLYLLAIVISLVATGLARAAIGPDAPARARLGATGLWVTVPAALLFGAGLSLPLMTVEKGWFWENDFSVLIGIGEMFRNESVTLAVAVSLFVVAVPTLRFVGLVLLRVQHETRGRLVAVLRTVDRWSMADVFTLAVLVVLSKLGDLASVTPRIGMWLLLAGSLLSAVDSILLERAIRSRRVREASSGTGQDERGRQRRPAAPGTGRAAGDPAQ